MNKDILSSAVLYRSLDADFQTVMEHAGFSGTPREIVTIKDLQHHWWYLNLIGELH